MFDAAALAKLPFLRGQLPRSDNLRMINHGFERAAIGARRRG
jgi:hypothetical protein